MSDPHLDNLAVLLTQHRQEVLDHWLAAASAQPFHHDRREDDVADHVPSLLDALIDLMRRSGPSSLVSGAPTDDEAVLRAATAHAHQRFDQGLHPIDVVTEFRLLRKEIGRAIWDHLPDDTSARAAGAAEIFVHDALDATTTLALTGLISQIEEVREVILATTLHEAMQPITSIKGGIQLARRMLRRQEIDVAGTTDSLHRAEVATDQIKLMLDRLAYVSRLALSHLELRLHPTDLVEVVRAALGRLQVAASGRVTFDDAPGPDTMGEWDTDALGEVASNLLSNALKYSPAATPITIRVYGEGDSVHLSVSDRGIGLEPAEAAQLFERYARASGAVEHGIPGIGLGLYLVRGIVEAHGGRISVESGGRDQGATFHVVIPRVVPPPRATRLP